MSRTRKPWVPSVLVEKGKHGDAYWDATTLEAFQASAFTILKDRYESSLKGWFWYHEPSAPDEYTGLSLDEIKALKDKDRDLYKRASGKWNRHKSQLRDYQRAREWWTALEACVENQDKAAAWEVLDMRNDYEYEKVSIERLERADTD